MNPWFGTFEAAYTLFVALLIIAGVVAWVVDAMRHHRARCNRILSPPRLSIRGRRV